MTREGHGRASEERIDLRIARLAATRHGIFTRGDAVRAGATRGLIEWRIATARWEPLHPGVYRLSGTPVTWKQRLLAACLVAGPDATASHRAAAKLRELPGGIDGIIEISVPGHRRVRRPGIRVHRAVSIPQSDVTLVEAIPTTTPTRTLIDLAGVVAPDVLEEALDDALRRRLTSLARLRSRIDALGRRGRRGVGTLQALIEQRTGAGPVTESVLETRFLRLLRRARLPLPACQYEIRENGKVIARPDFAYPAFRLAIEVDGYRWHAGRRRWERDLARRNELTARGWRVIHVTATDQDVRAERFIAMVAAALRPRRG